MKILEKQGYHLFFLAFLLLGAYLAIGGSNLDGSFLKLSSGRWFWLSILIPVIHQVYVVVLWRAELYYQMMTKWFGKKAFTIWAVGFLFLLLVRPLVIICLAIADRGSLFIPPWLSWGVGALFFIPVIYLGYSIKKFFGFKRAMGLDHFHPEDYKGTPLVKQGIYKWTPNPMYIFGFLMFWIPGLLLFSEAAIISAAFSHLYVWVHYYFTEYPDMVFIYIS